MRKTVIAPEEIYHVYNRGNQKQRIFNVDRDCVRFMFLVLFLQSSRAFSNIRREVDFFIKHGSFDTVDLGEEVLKKRTVELIAFALMPTHFHLLVRELEDGGLSHYLLRVQDAYTKYFNIKYERVGHLFQGPYGAVRVEDNDQLLYLSTYIHRNASELRPYQTSFYKYPWSSYPDYFKNRWGELLQRGIVLGQFKDSAEYKRFVDTSIAKLPRELDESLIHPSPYRR